LAKNQKDPFKAPMPLVGSGILINSSELKIVRTIGSGSCGEVSEANWKGTRVAGTVDSISALFNLILYLFVSTVKKIFRTLLHGDALKEFQVESDMLRRLRHPQIVLFMGTCLQGKDMCIITEFIDRGSLFEVLKDASVTFDWATILKMATDAAKGMNYLHTYSPPIIHRDLKSHNLLVDKNFNVKITDLGLAKFQVEDKTMTFCGTLPWTAPEVFAGLLHLILYFILFYYYIRNWILRKGRYLLLWNRSLGNVFEKRTLLWLEQTSNYCWCL
jgi:serine/threonine protein kinase